ncbi:hypothetical protein F2Q68_00043877 [Brassica cretica]|uniref:Uncharacterized protein n=1 Tax=Brassica cretica TaxID=69181 RepID=A0A8S9LIV9_BRACR|nr:hypothetical protein F2Q68_00043877 [Brassica cretica]
MSIDFDVDRAVRMWVFCYELLVKLFHIQKYGRFSLSEVFQFPGGKGRSWGPDLEYFVAGNRGSFQRGSWEPGFLPAGIQRLMSCLGSGGIQYLSIFPQQFPLIARFRYRTRGITCALTSSRVAHSQQASLRIDPLTPDRGLALLNRWFFVEDGKIWTSDGISKPVEPGALTP